MTQPRWRKSRHSGQQTACVELAHTRDLVRDSKNPTGPTLIVNLRPFLAELHTGRFDA